MNEQINIIVAGETDGATSAIGEVGDVLSRMEGNLDKLPSSFKAAEHALGKLEKQFEDAGDAFEESNQKILDVIKKASEFGAEAGEMKAALQAVVGTAGATGERIAIVARHMEELIIETQDTAKATEMLGQSMAFAARTGLRVEDAVAQLTDTARGGTQALRSLSARGAAVADALDKVRDPILRGRLAVAALNREMARSPDIFDRVGGSVDTLRVQFAQLGPAGQILQGALLAGAGAATAFYGALVKLTKDAVKAYIKQNAEAKEATESLNKAMEGLKVKLGEVAYEAGGGSEAIAGLESVIEDLTDAVKAAEEEGTAMNAAWSTILNTLDNAPTIIGPTVRLLQDMRDALVSIGREELAANKRIAQIEKEMAAREKAREERNKRARDERKAQADEINRELEQAEKDAKRDAQQRMKDKRFAGGVPKSKGQGGGRAPEREQTLDEFLGSFKDPAGSATLDVLESMLPKEPVENIGLPDEIMEVDASLNDVYASAGRMGQAFEDAFGVSLETVEVLPGLLDSAGDAMWRLAEAAAGAFGQMLAGGLSVRDMWGQILGATAGFVDEFAPVLFQTALGMLGIQTGAPIIAMVASRILSGLLRGFGKGGGRRGGGGGSAPTSSASFSGFRERASERRDEERSLTVEVSLGGKAYKKDHVEWVKRAGQQRRMVDRGRRRG